MIKRMLCLSTLSLLLMSMLAFSAPAARAQQAEAPKQPVVYTYVSFFGVPRAQWGAYEKSLSGEHKTFDGLLADGTILSYGDAAFEVHEGLNAPTHVGWFTSSSVAGLMKALTALQAQDHGGMLCSVALRTAAGDDSRLELRPPQRAGRVVIERGLYPELDGGKQRGDVDRHVRETSARPTVLRAAGRSATAPTGRTGPPRSARSPSTMS